MKKFKNLTKMTAMLAIAFLAFSCSDDDDNSPAATLPETITELAVATPELSILVDALTIANLAETLDQPGSYTVFAPTNAAFTAFLAQNNIPSLNDVPVDVLTQILLNHVVVGENASTSLSTGYVSTLATQPNSDLNLSMFIDTTNGVTLNGVSNVAIADIDATNGIIHVVDAVIGLPTVVTQALANPAFSSLVAALSAADGDLVSVLSGAGTFTVLAPDNAAFTTFLNGAALGDVPTDALANILLNHVLGSVVTSTDLVGLGSGYTNTLATGPSMENLSLYFNATEGVSFNGISSVTAADVVTTNGIIHAVDTVIGLPTIATFATSNPALGNLVSALQLADTGSPTVDYIATVSDATAGPFTVFAPTNDAFAALLLELDPSGNTTLSDLNPATVDAVLLKHIVSGNIQSSGLPNGPVATLGGNITADNTAFTLTDPNNRVSNIITSLVDIQAINGVVHVIDKVILPAQ